MRKHYTVTRTQYAEERRTHATDRHDRGPRPHQVLRRIRGTARSGRPGPARRPLHGAGPARSQRRGQDHRRTHPGHAHHRRQRNGPHRRVRRRRRPEPGAPHDQPHRAVRRRRRGADRRGEPAHDGPADRPLPHGRAPPGRRTARTVRPHRGGPPPRPYVLRRHAAQARPGGGPGRQPAAGGVLPGRADDRPRPAQPPGALAGGPRSRRRGRHGPAHHPVTWTRPTGWPTASPSSTGAGRSPRAPRTR